MKGKRRSKFQVRVCAIEVFCNLEFLRKFSWEPYEEKIIFLTTLRARFMLKSCDSEYYVFYILFRKHRKKRGIWRIKKTFFNSIIRRTIIKTYYKLQKRHKFVSFRFSNIRKLSFKKMYNFGVLKYPRKIISNEFPPWIRQMRMRAVHLRVPVISIKQNAIINLIRARKIWITMKFDIFYRKIFFLIFFFFITTKQFKTILGFFSLSTSTTLVFITGILEFAAVMFKNRKNKRFWFFCSRISYYFFFTKKFVKKLTLLRISFRWSFKQQLYNYIIFLPYFLILIRIYFKIFLTSLHFICLFFFKFLKNYTKYLALHTFFFFFFFIKFLIFFLLFQKFSFFIIFRRFFRFFFFLFFLFYVAFRTLYKNIFSLFFYYLNFFIGKKNRFFSIFIFTFFKKINLVVVCLFFTLKKTLKSGKYKKQMQKKKYNYVLTKYHRRRKVMLRVAYEATKEFYGISKNILWWIKLRDIEPLYWILKHNFFNYRLSFFRLLSKKYVIFFSLKNIISFFLFKRRDKIFMGLFYWFTLEINNFEFFYKNFYKLKSLLFYVFRWKKYNYFWSFYNRFKRKIRHFFIRLFIISFKRKFLYIKKFKKLRKKKTKFFFSFKFKKKVKIFIKKSKKKKFLLNKLTKYGKHFLLFFKQYRLIRLPRRIFFKKKKYFGTFSSLAYFRKKQKRWRRRLRRLHLYVMPLWKRRGLYIKRHHSYCVFYPLRRFIFQIFRMMYTRKSFYRWGRFRFFFKRMNKCSQVLKKRKRKFFVYFIFLKKQKLLHAKSFLNKFAFLRRIQKKVSFAFFKICNLLIISYFASKKKRRIRYFSSFNWHFFVKFLPAYSFNANRFQNYFLKKHTFLLLKYRQYLLWFFKFKQKILFFQSFVFPFYSLKLFYSNFFLNKGVNFSYIFFKRLRLITNMFYFFKFYFFLFCIFKTFYKFNFFSMLVKLFVFRDKTQNLSFLWLNEFYCFIKNFSFFNYFFLFIFRRIFFLIKFFNLYKGLYLSMFFLISKKLLLWKISFLRTVGLFARQRWISYYAFFHKDTIRFSTILYILSKNYRKKINSLFYYFVSRNNKNVFFSIINNNVIALKNKLITIFLFKKSMYFLFFKKNKKQKISYQWVSYKSIIHVEFVKKFFFFYNYILNFFFKRINLHIFVPTTDVFFTLFWPLFFWHYKNKDVLSSINNLKEKKIKKVNKINVYMYFFKKKMLLKFLKNKYQNKFSVINLRNLYFFFFFKNRFDFFLPTGNGKYVLKTYFKHSFFINILTYSYCSLKVPSVVNSFSFINLIFSGISTFFSYFIHIKINFVKLFFFSSLFLRSLRKRSYKIFIWFFFFSYKFFLYSFFKHLTNIFLISNIFFEQIKVVSWKMLIFHLYFLKRFFFYFLHKKQKARRLLLLFRSVSPVSVAFFRLRYNIFICSTQFYRKSTSKSFYTPYKILHKRRVRTRFRFQNKLFFFSMKKKLGGITWSDFRLNTSFIKKLGWIFYSKLAFWKQFSTLRNVVGFSRFLKKKKLFYKKWLYEGRSSSAEKFFRNVIFYKLHFILKTLVFFFKKQKYKQKKFNYSLMNFFSKFIIFCNFDGFFFNFFWLMKKFMFKWKFFVLKKLKLFYVLGCLHRGFVKRKFLKKKRLCFTFKIIYWHYCFCLVKYVENFVIEIYFGRKLFNVFSLYFFLYTKKRLHWWLKSNFYYFNKIFYKKFLRRKKIYWRFLKLKKKVVFFNFFSFFKLFCKVSNVKIINYFFSNLLSMISFKVLLKIKKKYWWLKLIFFPLFNFSFKICCILLRNSSIFKSCSTLFRYFDSKKKFYRQKKRIFKNLKFNYKVFFKRKKLYFLKNFKNKKFLILKKKYKKKRKLQRKKYKKKWTISAKKLILKKFVFVFYKYYRCFFSITVVLYNFLICYKNFSLYGIFFVFDIFFLRYFLFTFFFNFFYSFLQKFYRLFFELLLAENFCFKVKQNVLLFFLRVRKICKTFSLVSLKHLFVFRTYFSKREGFQRGKFKRLRITLLRPKDRKFMYPNEESKLVRELWTSVKVSSNQPKAVAEGFFNIYFLQNKGRLAAFNKLFLQQLQTFRAINRNVRLIGNIKLQKEKKMKKNENSKLFKLKLNRL